MHQMHQFKMHQVHYRKWENEDARDTLHFFLSAKKNREFTSVVRFSFLSSISEKNEEQNPLSKMIN